MNDKTYIVPFVVDERGFRIWGKPIRKDKYIRLQKLKKINKLND